MHDIDFVMIWVDGDDPEWKKEKEKYKPDRTLKIDDGEERYRDWNNLKYWFRAVEKFAPWVRKVHFVTCGQLPDWINLSAPKLHFVKHSNYMPKEYLPTFSSHPIELNLHRIEGLSNQFVYFNDDMFLCRYVEPELFFKKGVPIHPAVLHAILPIDDANSEIMSHIYLNMMTAVNRNFDAKASISKNRSKWFNPGYCGLKGLAMNLFNAQHHGFVGFENEHLPVPILKCTMDEVWEKEYDLLHGTSLRKFRSSLDVSQYLFRYWDLAKGNFEAIYAGRLGKRFSLKEDCRKICGVITSQKYRMICLNDVNEPCDRNQFEKVKKQINEAFDFILPEKSSFEK